MGPFAFQKDGVCMGIALVNAVHVTVGEKETRKVLNAFGGQSQQLLKLKECSEVVRILKVGLQLTKLDKE